jgi:2'-hydroxyisoflavone reductase
MSPVWVEYDFLERNGATEGRALPIWAPPTPEMAHVATVSGRRAAEQGLRNRPTRETARDTIAWWKTLPAERTESMRAGLSAAQETELLKKWQDRKKM